MATPYADLQNPHQTSGLVELYTLDASSIGGDVYRFTPHPNGSNPVVFGGLSYSPMPIAGEGFDFTAGSAPPKPTLQVSNVAKTLLYAVIGNNDLVGCKVSRRRVFAKHLDAATFSRVNVFNYSEQFDNAYWTKGSVTLNLNSTTAPNGSLTGTQVIETAASAIHQIQRGSLSFVTGTTYTYSTYVKFAGRSTFRMNLPAGGFGTAANAAFDLSSGTVTSSQNCIPLMQDAGNGWFRCAITATATSTTTGAAFLRLTNAGVDTFTGSGGPSIYLFGAQFEANSMPTLYQMTTTTHQPFADSTAFIGPDDYIIEVMQNRNSEFIQWQLTSILDRFGMKLPRRQILKRDFPGVSRNGVR